MQDKLKLEDELFLIELPSDSPMPHPKPGTRHDYYQTVPVQYQLGVKPGLKLDGGRIGVSTTSDAEDQDEILLQVADINSVVQGVLVLNELNAARLASAIIHWLASKKV